MSEKIWKYKYKDTVKVTTEYDEMLGENVDCKTAEHHPGWNAPIVYDGGVCYIYSDRGIGGLELVGRNVCVGD